MFFQQVRDVTDQWHKIFVKGGGFRYEDDISAEKETEIQSSWIQKENEHCQWQKGIIQKKSKR